MAASYGFVIFLISQIIADFAVRREILTRENTSPKQPMWIHLVVFFGVSSILITIVSANTKLYLQLETACALATISHLILDWIFARTSLWQADVGSKQRWLFVAQQGLKVVVAYIMVWSSIEGVYSCGLSPSDTVANVSIGFGFCFGYVFSIFAGDAFVSLALTKLSWQGNKSSDGTLGAGRLIGIFEAVLITTFIIAHQYAAIGIVLAAKSVARYECLKDKQGMAEYFLVGTLANLTWAMLGGILALWIAGLPILAAG